LGYLVFLLIFTIDLKTAANVFNMLITYSPEFGMSWQTLTNFKVRY